MNTTRRSNTFISSLFLFVVLALLGTAPGHAQQKEGLSCHARCANGDCWCVLCHCGCSTGFLAPNTPWCGERYPTVAYTTQNTTVSILPFVGDAGEILLSSNALARNASNGTVSVGSGGGFDYTPNPGFTGQDSFTFRICNFYAQCDFGTVLVDVMP